MKKEKPKKIQNGFSDFTTEKPCKVKVTARYKNTGNALLGFNAFDNKPWRFGKHISQLHPETHIEIQGENTYRFRTAKVLAYLIENSESIPVYRGKGFHGMPNSSYVVNIKKLAKYCEVDNVLQHAA
jgi:hypothetical protein